MYNFKREKLYKMKSPIKTHITKYLIGGDLIEWNGKKSDVYSVIKNENNLPTYLGSTPCLDEKVAVSAIEQADIAYNRGREKNGLQ